MLVIGIAGGTASGKTSLVNKLKEIYAKDILEVISQDSYYHKTDHLSMQERMELNFDHPNSLDFDLLVKHIGLLKTGITIEQPSYSFIAHNRTDQFQKIVPKKILIIEGILILNDKRLVNLMDYKIYIDAPNEHRFQRRLKRDIKERGRTEEEVTKRYKNTLQPMHDLFVAPTKDISDQIIFNGDATKNAFEELKLSIEKQL
ncbi:uridine kinase [Flavicella sediminum]|uniref:uridine kinase n=1 Tax=Flavicella sediminum TaxID=2585141 RepID=UPI001123535E|nr:uridine kinase [Flavicella sediminum]